MEGSRGLQTFGSPGAGSAMEGSRSLQTFGSAGAENRVEESCGLQTFGSAGAGNARAQVDIRDGSPPTSLNATTAAEPHGEVFWGWQRR